MPGNHCKLLVLISGDGSNLQAFIDQCQSDELPASICAVISNRPQAYGLERARQAGIDALCIDHSDYESREHFDQALMLKIDEYAPALIILAGFMRILTPAFVKHYHGRLLNIHPSLLPKYPGLETHQRAIDAGDRQTGATVHFVTEQLDGGPPVIQATVPISADDDAASLARKTLQYEHRIYPLAAKWFVEGRLSLAGNRAVLDGEILPASGYSFNP